MADGRWFGPNLTVRPEPFPAENPFSEGRLLFGNRVALLTIAVSYAFGRILSRGQWDRGQGTGGTNNAPREAVEMETVATFQRKETCEVP